MTLKDSESRVQVGVRVRPLTGREIQQRGQNVLSTTSTSVRLGERQFTYDAVFDADASQGELYSSVAPPLLSKFVGGYNATIMAYGQTGSGKTFTMGSEAHFCPDSALNCGLIPRFMSDFFGQLQRRKKACGEGEQKVGALLEYGMKASFLEVYGEDVFDLLQTNRQPLPVREDSGGGVVITGLTARMISNPDEGLQVLHDGTTNRTTASTLMNLTSSRSHAVFTIHLSQTYRSDEGGQAHVTSTSKFTFVDLAGSERMKKTGAEGERAREGIKINEGLLALGNVINALADEERLLRDRKIHIPYRQSKLTRLLQDALGGNSQTLFLACVSPSDTNAGETLSTLHYANRAKNIRNRPAQNIDKASLELQRLCALTAVLKAELIKFKFGAQDDGERNIGQINNEVLARSEVEEYLNELNRVAANMASLSPEDLLPTQPGPDENFKKAQPNESASATTLPERLDESFLINVNPDEDLALLDRLLELQQHDNDFNKEKKRGDEELQQMDGEIVKEQSILLQLRQSLKAYHNMKNKYEALMAEVQQLESEKTSLALQLEKSSEDPSTGCSVAIRRQLERVELSLTRARRETLSHREKCKLAEEQARKCRDLERRINDLKHAKTALMKKQKVAAARHREVTEAKAKEITAMKRKEKAAEIRMNKLKTELNQHKAISERRGRYCNKLNEKLKQTESHLMKLLATRQNKLLDHQKKTPAHTCATGDDSGESKQHTISTKEFEIMHFLERKLVNDRVKQANLLHRYHDINANRTDLMRKVVLAVQSLKQERHKFATTGTSTPKQNVEELMSRVAELELQLELADTELEGIKAHMDKQHLSVDQVDYSPDESVNNSLSMLSQEAMKAMILGTSAKLVEAESDKEKLKVVANRKDAALMSFESEVETAHRKLKFVSTELSRYKEIAESEESSSDRICHLLEKNRHLAGRLHTAEELRLSHLTQIEELSAQLKEERQGHTATKDKLSLAEAVLEKHNLSSESFATLEELQLVLDHLGVDMQVRDKERHDIASSIETTCERKLKEALKLKESTIKEITMLSSTLDAMSSALEITTQTQDCSENCGLLEQAQILKDRVKKLQIPFRYATARRFRLIKDTESLCAILGMTYETLPTNLKKLMMPRHVGMMPQNNIGRASRNPGDDTGDSDMPHPRCADESNPNAYAPSSLKGSFLAACENEVASMRVKKAEVMSKNREMCDDLSKVLQKLHVTADDLVELVERILVAEMHEIPSWWNQAHATTVVRHASSNSAPLDSTGVDTDHLSTIHRAVMGIAKSRQCLTTALRAVVERAQETLLEIVGNEIDAREAYASLHEALFKLPELSKDLCLACVSEMETLVNGVETMTQSEIEALTVVWEALDVSARERRSFWGIAEHVDPGQLGGITSPFDSTHQVLSTSKEDWISEAASKAAHIHQNLDKKLGKLRKIHQEVERLRSKQDAKSQILTLDSEIRILTARLKDFEEFRCDKKRLLTKKNGGCGLLREERFRKQMQGKFVAKLGQLAGLLKSWEKAERSTFDSALLSDDVQMLLREPAKMDSWVEQRTKFMMLRTVKPQTPTRRGVLNEADKNSQIPSANPRRGSREEEPPKPVARRHDERNERIRHAIAPTNPRRKRTRTEESDQVARKKNKDIPTTQQGKTGRGEAKRNNNMKDRSALPPFGRILRDDTSHRSVTK